MVRRVKLAVVCFGFCLLMISCGEKKAKTPENATIPERMESKNHTESTMVPVQASTTRKNTSIYTKTYVYHDTEFNAKAVPFRILKLDTKKVYKVPADEERLKLLEVANSYFKDIAKREGLTKEQYSLDELEYVYELNDQLLYMPVYLKYRAGESSGEEHLYNLIVKMEKNTFELVGQTDRALLDEERYPRKRLVDIPEEKVVNDYPVDDQLYNQFFTEGERVEDEKTRSYFLEQMKQHLMSELTVEESDDSIRIGIVDLVKNSRNAYFSLLEIVFYDTNNNIEKVRRFQLVDPAGILGEVIVNDLGSSNSIVEITPDDYIMVSGQELYVAGISEDAP